VQGAEAQAHAFFESGAAEAARGRLFFMRLQTNERALGVVALWPGENPREIDADRTWLRALLELCAIAIDRARLIGEVAETRVVAEREGLRTALLSSLSHDLRTPISTILASATSLQEHDRQFDETTKRELLDTIQDETERLNRYVSNLLEMTRLESGALRVNRELIDPGEAMASALDRVRRRLGRRRVRRAFESGGTRIQADPVLLEQALANVIENAVSYTPDGANIYAATRLDGDEVVLSIEDDGPGIAPADLSVVFDKFFRGRSDRRGAAGVGLGLSVTRGIVEAFAGRVSAHSPARGNRGARIEVRLPAQPALEAVE
jgi:two-component system sensor histidine kinase KdpD